MSRNFELLSQSGRMHEELQSELERPAAPDNAPPVAEAFSSIPSLEMVGSVQDEITKLVHNLFLLPDGPRRVVFSGTESGCGCSWICAHAAEVLASQVRGTVCIVDANLRFPGLHRQFGVENHNGLSDLLLQGNPVHHYVHRLARANLWFLSCGSASDEWQTLVGSDRMRTRLAELRSAFDYVLIDAAALNSCNDALVLGGLCDGVVMVMKANSSRRAIARNALQGLRAANVRTLGAVLNQRTFPIPQAIYNLL